MLKFFKIIFISTWNHGLTVWAVKFMFITGYVFLQTLNKILEPHIVNCVILQN